jgi:hypothetical protein
MKEILLFTVNKIMAENAVRKKEEFSEMILKLFCWAGIG